jgi:RNA polymerase sigma-70 factor (ECF subfamily)
VSDSIAYPGDVQRQTDQFLRLLGIHERRLRAFVFSLVPNWSDADDIVQQTRMRLWQQFGDYDPAKDFGAWSRTVAHYLILAHREQKTRQPQLLSTEFLQAVEQGFAEAEATVGLRHDAMSHCLNQLDEPKRKLFMRYYLGSQTLVRLAEEVGRTRDAVKHSLVRTRMWLAECIERRLAAQSSATEGETCAE